MRSTPAEVAVPADRRPGMRWLLGLCTVAITALLVFKFQTYFLHTFFDRWDDEGYMMVMLQHYLSGLKLYTEMFAQYGPFYFEAQSALLHILHLSVTTDSNRLLAELWWLGSATLGGIFCYRMRANLLLACAASLAVLGNTSVLAVEPGHPQQVVLFLMMLACVAATLRPQIGAVLLGAAVAATCLTKINVGVFSGVAVLATVAALIPKGWCRKLLQGAMLLYAACFPAVLMHRDLHGADRWYAVIATLVGVTTFWAAFQTGCTDDETPVRFRWVLPAFAVAVLLIIAIPIAEGVTAKTILDGVLIEPSKHPMVFNFPLGELSRRLAFFCLLFCGLSLFALTRKQRRIRLEALLLLAAPMVVLGFILYGEGRRADFCLGILPLAFLRLRDGQDGGKHTFARVLVTLLAATQMLHAYPVAGSQLRIGLTPSILWCFLCLLDSWEAWKLVYPALCVSRMALPAYGIAIYAMVALSIYRGAEWLPSVPSSPNHLPGAAAIRFLPQQAAALDNISTNVRANCDMLFSLPGLGSFNFWSGAPLPDGFFMNGWLPGVPEAEQEHTLARLKSDPQSCVIYDPWSIKFWHFKADELASKPLSRYILTEMRPVHSVYGYQILVSPVRIASWNDIPSTPVEAPAHLPHMLEFSQPKP